MKFYNYAFLTLLLSFFSFTTAHKYYLSLTTVTYVEASKELQLTSEFFIDDLEKGLMVRYGDGVSLSEDNSKEETTGFIERYLNDKLRINVNDELVLFNFLGFEYKQDKIVCYLEAKNVPEISTFEVSNTSLFELFPEQKNVVKLKINDLEKSILLIKDKSAEQLQIK